MANTVHVKDISNQTSEKDVRDFFSFCGKITSLSVTPTSDAADATKSATVTFEKETAAKTALLLDNTQLGPAQVHVSSAASLGDIAGSKATTSTEDSKGDDVEQEDKPRSRIVAEYLAHGYAISDKAIEKAISLDNQHGVSAKFLKTLNDFDQRTKATERAQTMDTKYGVSSRADTAWRGIYSYFDKAMGTPTGQRIRQFYTQTNQQVLDVHNEARHLANLKSGKPSVQEHPGGKTTCQCGGDDGNCPCAEGQCACVGCSKSTTTTPDAEKAGTEKGEGETK
ncbi:MAG: hypothetical protein M1820_005625 [Bogoriella megaspora]|nr:MAG: hypothetical protein M1820_005625 [Bogoriella megaspora]